MPDPIHTPSCFRGHMGQYMIEPGFMSQAVAAIRAGLWKPGDVLAVGAFVPHAAANKKVVDPETAHWDTPLTAYVVTDGIAVIDMSGAMAKAKGKYANVGTVSIRRYLRMCVADSDVQGILLNIDSPGGTCAGTQQLGDEIIATGNVKPVHAHIEDCGASAAYWIACQADYLTASSASLIGSLGTYVVLEDSSEQAKMEGVKVHVISTGPQKGAFVDGAPITKEQLAEAQNLVDSLNALFMDAVAAGRQMEPKKVASLFDGRVHIAAKAKELGLIDSVSSFEGAVSALAATIVANRPPPPAPDNARRMRLARAQP